MPGPNRHDHWFEPVADHLGAAYLRYSFTKGTRAGGRIPGRPSSVCRPGMRVLDVGCGPGRHAYAARRTRHRGPRVDISRRFVELASASAPGRRDVRAARRQGDAVRRRVRRRDLPLPGRVRPDDRRRTRRHRAGRDRARPATRRPARAQRVQLVLRRSSTGRAPSSTPRPGVNHEHTEIRNEAGEAVADRSLDGLLHAARAATCCASATACASTAISSVEPGAYSLAPPTVDSPEFLLLATRIH